MNRRIFEDAFSNQFFSKGVSSEASYRDITFSKDVNKDVLAKKMAERGCDSVVLTRLIGQRKEIVTTTAYDPVYSPGPYYGGYGRYNRPGHYGSWGNYYGHPHAFSYMPTTTTERVILTVESVMYDLKLLKGALIKWLKSMCRRWRKTSKERRLFDFFPLKWPRLSNYLQVLTDKTRHGLLPLNGVGHSYMSRLVRGESASFGNDIFRKLYHPQKNGHLVAGGHLLFIGIYEKLSI
jgi:hypothetical protein